VVLPSRPARYPHGGERPAQMRADMAAAFLNFETTGELHRAIIRGEAPRPTATELRGGRREPLWSLDALRADIARRHGQEQASAPSENIADLI
jgi:hypothetical protein